MSDASESPDNPDNPPQPPSSSAWRRFRASRWGRWVIDLTLLALIFSAISMWQTRDMTASGEPAPNTILESFGGDVVNFEHFRGKKTLVVFWAPWCGVCGAESDNIDRVRRLVGDRVHVTSVVLDYGSRQAVQRFIDEHDVQYPVLLGKTQTAQDYQVSVFPTLYVLDERGAVEHTLVGYTTTLGLLWRVLL